LHPFSHGSVHITSSSSLDPPAINPEYFSDNVDLDVHVRGRRWLKDVVSRLSWVRGSLIDESGGEEESVKRDALTVFHPVGLSFVSDYCGVTDVEGIDWYSVHVTA
jgi:choline dehydrogenase-like flavoprotein